MNLWEPADWCNISQGQKGQTTAFWGHGIKSDGEKRNYGTFCLTQPEENYWLLCGSRMIVSGISCSAVIKIQLLVTAGTQMPFWIVQSAIVLPSTQVMFQNMLQQLIFIPFDSYIVVLNENTGDTKSCSNILFIKGKVTCCQSLWVLYRFTLCQEGKEDNIKSMHVFKSLI